MATSTLDDFAVPPPPDPPNSAPVDVLDDDDNHHNHDNPSNEVAAHGVNNPLVFADHHDDDHVEPDPDATIEPPPNVQIPPATTEASPKRKNGRKRNGTVLRKAPQAPKRFKSSYIMFFMSKQSEIKEMLGSTASVSDISRKSGELWKLVTKEERAHWDSVAAKDKERYMTEKASYTGPWQVPWKRARKDPTAPKRPMSAFLYFSQGRRQAVKDKNPDIKNTEVSRILGEMWRSASIEERKPYVDREKADRGKYKIAIAKWRKESEARTKAEKKLHAEQMAMWQQQQQHHQQQQQQQQQMQYHMHHPQRLMQTQHQNQHQQQQTSPNSSQGQPQFPKQQHVQHHDHSTSANQNNSQQRNPRNDTEGRPAQGSDPSPSHYNPAQGFPVHPPPPFAGYPHPPMAPPGYFPPPYPPTTGSFQYPTNGRQPVILGPHGMPRYQQPPMYPQQSPQDSQNSPNGQTGTYQQQLRPGQEGHHQNANQETGRGHESSYNLYSV
eukprot:CAMPEP_0119550732 /NCGR_PEP_ID=MMETSP1352-20130426/4194_1 /TAXON_ID=265584 /ORGANISM="Stauroneis constricta, Strain CCMP1120" /LENGTH=494 /DNA_ID=CAMNT_0007596679 /DNA_START=86 /DNA_END=1570 /DNA_ORIENTATION=-